MAAEKSPGGVGFCGLLTILFIGLKLGGVISWSWLWVLSPLWISFAVFILFMIVGLLIIAFAADSHGFKRSRWR